VYPVPVERKAHGNNFAMVIGGILTIAGIVSLFKQ
jgi:hypothetical protein